MAIPSNLYTQLNFFIIRILSLVKKIGETKLEDTKL